MQTQFAQWASNFNLLRSVRYIWNHKLVAPQNVLTKYSNALTSILSNNQLHKNNS